MNRSLSWLAVLLLLTSCDDKDGGDYLPFPPKITSVENNYHLSNGNAIRVTVSGRNMKSPEQNRFYIDGSEISSKEDLLSGDQAYIVRLPGNTFSEKHMSNKLVFSNGHGEHDMEIFSEGFPVIESISTGSTIYVYPGDEIVIEGVNLSYKEGVSEIFFPSDVSDNGRVKADIKKGNNFIVRFIMPEYANAGVVIYKTFVAEEESHRIILCGTIKLRN